MRGGWNSRLGHNELVADWVYWVRPGIANSCPSGYAKIVDPWVIGRPSIIEEALGKQELKVYPMCGFSSNSMWVEKKNLEGIGKSLAKASGEEIQEMYWEVVLVGVESRSNVRKGCWRLVAIHSHGGKNLTIWILCLMWRASFMLQRC